MPAFRPLGDCAFMCLTLLMLDLWGSSSGFGSAVRMASRASCFALLNLMKGIFLGSHSSVMFKFGYESISPPNWVRNLMEVSWSSCGYTSSALLTAKLE